MKKNLFFLVMAVAALTTTACNPAGINDNVVPAGPPIEVGTYAVKLQDPGAADRAYTGGASMCFGNMDPHDTYMTADLLPYGGVDRENYTYLWFETKSGKSIQAVVPISLLDNMAWNPNGIWSLEVSNVPFGGTQIGPDGRINNGFIYGRIW